MRYTKRIVLFLALLAAPVLANAQVDDPQKDNKSEIKVNKLDVIYEDEEFKGVVIDNRNAKETENIFYQAPFIIDDDEEEEDDDEGMPRNRRFTLDDLGAESEDEIILVGFDTASIHLPKLDVSTLEEPIILKLRDNADELRVIGSFDCENYFTNYKGVDPEVAGGIDNNMYPRSRNFLVGASFNF